MDIEKRARELGFGPSEQSVSSMQAIKLAREAADARAEEIAQAISSGKPRQDNASAYDDGWFSGTERATRIALFSTVREKEQVLTKPTPGEVRTWTKPAWLADYIDLCESQGRAWLKVQEQSKTREQVLEEALREIMCRCEEDMCAHHYELEECPYLHARRALERKTEA
jgi:hypothetical protein